MISEIIISTLLSLTPAEKSTLKNLETRLKKEGYDISQYVNDPEFKVYTFVGGNGPLDYSDTTKCWYLKKHFIKKCVYFSVENWTLLERIKNDFGIIPEKLISQFQLESQLGEKKGEYPVINALVSKYLHRRGEIREMYFKNLKEYLRLCADTTDNIILSSNPLKNYGSSSGAIGGPQIMPYNLNNFLIDYNKDGKRDPNNKEDAMGSMASVQKRNKYNLQKYNPGDEFYKRAIDNHTWILIKEMEKRARMPPEKISYKVNPSILDIKPPQRDILQQTKITAMIPEMLPRQPFIKRILYNFKAGRR